MESILVKAAAGVFTLAFVAFIAVVLGRRIERTKIQEQHIEIGLRAKKNALDVADADTGDLVDELFEGDTEGMHVRGTDAANEEPSSAVDGARK